MSEGVPRALYVPKWPLGGHSHGSWHNAVDLRGNAIGEELGDEAGRDVVRGNEESECAVVRMRCQARSPGAGIRKSGVNRLQFESMDHENIRSGLERIRAQIYRGDESEIWIWVIQDRLACAQRPLRDNPNFGGGPGRRPPPLPPEARPFLEAWVDRVIQGGFRSVISLLEVAQLERHYIRGGINLHSQGLLGYYRHRGLKVQSVPCTDYQRPSDRQMHKIQEAFLRLPRPALLHCSAGIDRTSPVAAFLSGQENSK